MIYPFSCKCGEYTETWRKVADAGNKEICSECGKDMARIYTPPTINIPNIEGYNHGLGCSNRETKETIRKIEAETGREIVEMGDDKSRGHVKEKETNLELTKTEEREARAILNG